MLNKKRSGLPLRKPDPLYYLSRFFLSPYTSRHFVQILVHIIRSDDYVLNVNEEEYVSYLIEEYTLSVPVIHFEDARIEPRKVLVDFDQPRHWMTSKAI